MAKRRPAYNPRRFEARRLAERGGEEVDRGGEEVDRGGEEVDRGGEEVDRGGEEVDRGGEEVDRGRKEAAIDIFRTATSLGGFMVIAFVAPVGGFAALSAGQVLKSERDRKDTNLRRRRQAPRRRRRVARKRVRA
jgi:hypothetical protein